MCTSLGRSLQSQAAVNEQGGINGRKIKLICRDDGYSPPKTVEQARQLLEQEGLLERPARGPGVISPRKFAPVLHREHICIEIGDPLLTLLGDLQVAQRISDIGTHRLPEEIRIVRSQVSDALVIQFVAVPVSQNSLYKAVCFRR